MKEIAIKVATVTGEALGINSYELVAADTERLPEFSAGAHIDVHLPNGLVRQYSLCGGPRQEGCYRIAVLRDPKTRGGSKAMHELVNKGDVLRISVPRNLFPLVNDPSPSILLAGGIGITPLLSMAHELHAQGRPFALHYFARSRERAAFLDELMCSEFSEQVVLHLDDDASVGAQSVSELLSLLPRDTHVYACGPSGFLNHVLDITRVQSWPASQVHYETFAAPASVSGDSFEIRIASTGESVTVGPDETVVSAVARLGIEIPVSCEQGICGTCITRVLDGVPDHRDQYFSDAERAENDCFTPCCSRAKFGVLVLDL